MLDGLTRPQNEEKSGAYAHWRRLLLWWLPLIMNASGSCRRHTLEELDMAIWAKTGKWDNLEVSQSGRVSSKVSSWLRSPKGEAVLLQVSKLREAHVGKTATTRQQSKRVGK